MPITLRPAENSIPVAIIGGGASGLAAACVLARAGVSAVLLEKEARPGRKLLATGNGRCNILNAGEPVYFGGAAFARAVLSHCPKADVVSFLESIGLVLAEEDGGRVYPATGQAASVLECLLAQIALGPVEIRTGQAVTDIHQVDGGFRLSLQDGKTLSASRVLAAGGSPAAPRLGGSGELAAMVARLGHPVVPFSPALCGLLADVPHARELSGLRVPAYLALYVDNAAVCASAGELLFTDDGLSGVCAMQLARDADVALRQGKPVAVSVDFSPLLGLAPPLKRRMERTEIHPASARDKAGQLLRQRERALGKARLCTGLLPQKLARRLDNLSVSRLADALTDWRVPVTGTRGFDQAQTASGGLSCAAFSPQTMQSHAVPGLYALGEMLDVDGDTGGHNLLFAWATGLLAARHIVAETLP